MQIEIIPSNEIGKRVGELLVRQIGKKPNSVLGMTTGSTPIKLGIYANWIQREKEGQLNFEQTVFVNPDELVGIEAQHPESYSTYMEQYLFSHLATIRNKPHIPDGAAENLLKECERFEQLLSDLDYMDWQLMGLGANGHMAFIEPGEAISSSTYVVDIYDENQPRHSIHFRNQGEVPDQAITIGLGAVFKSKSIVLVAVGESKANIVRKALRGPISTKVPASFLQLHPDVTVILDEHAAKFLAV